MENAGRPVTRVVPEFSPQAEPVLYALGEPANATLVVAGPEGVAALPLAAAALALLPSSLPENTPCIAEPGVAALAEQVLHHQPVLQHPAERWVQAAQSPWDLAQFDLSSSSRARAMKKWGTAWSDVLAAPQWRPARWGALLLVALNVIGLNAWAWHERSALDNKRELMRRTLTTTFPNVKVVVDAPAQMEREVAALRQAAGASSGRDLETMLGALTTAAPPQRAVSGIDYVNGELRVRGMALGSEEARSVAGALKGQGYTGVMNGDALVVTQEAQP
jgi:general secretion pathway protein L